MKKYAALLFALVAGLNASAQMGSYQYDLKLNDGRTFHAQRSQPQFKFTNYNCYWFTKPGQDHYFFCNDVGGMGINILRGRAMDTTFTYRDKYQGAQIFFIVNDAQKHIAGIAQPDIQSPLNLHFSIFNPSEISFTYSGPVIYIDGKSGQKTAGTITGSTHLYREGRYEKSDQLSGCNCDPTIYAYRYDPEIGRTPSDCENAVLWKIFNAMKSALGKVIPGISYTGSDRPLPANTIIYNGTKGNIDITNPTTAVTPCNANNPAKTVVSPTAHQRLFTQDNYGFYFIKIPGADDLKPKSNNDQAALMKGYMSLMDSLTKAFAAHKITAEKEQAIAKAYMEKITGGQPDIKRMEVEYNLAVTAQINAQYDQAQARGLTASDVHPVVQHKVPGAAFEIMVPAAKDGDDNWTKNKLYIFFGKFNLVNSPTGIKSITPVFNPLANKLTLFNAVIMLDGGMDMINKAFNSMDFSAIPSLLQN